MIFGFDEHKGKVNVGAMLTQLQTNFQNNVNSLYDAFVSAGTTPTAKTPAALVTAVSTMINTIYNAFVAKGVTPAAKTVSALVTAVTTMYNKGVTDAQAVTWTETVTLTTSTSAGTTDPAYYPCSLDLSSIKDAVFSISDASNAYWDFLCVNSSGTGIGVYPMRLDGVENIRKLSTVIFNNQPTTTKVYFGPTTSSSIGKKVTITITRQAKKLR